MLVVTRRKNERVVIRAGDTVVRVNVASIRGDRVRLSFDAPAAVRIDREEVDAVRRAGVAGPEFPRVPPPEPGIYRRELTAEEVSNGGATASEAAAHAANAAGRIGEMRSGFAPPRQGDTP